MSQVNIGTAVGAGIVASSQAQRQASTDQAAHIATNHARTVDSKERAVKAVDGANDKESESAGERDADGRRAWEWILKQKQNAQQHREKSIDPSGLTGNSLDLNG